MNLRDHQLCELMEDGEEIYSRIKAIGNTVDRVFRANESIFRDLIAENRRLRISQLRRMRDAIASRAGGWAKILRDIPEGPRKSWRRRWLDKMERLDSACLAEIERLRGEG